MKMYKALFIVVLFFAFHIKAQPFTLKSVGEKKPFSLEIYYGTKGKGAFVQYKGQKGIIPLKIKSYKIDDSQREYGQPDFTSYVWDEIVDGKVNGTYYLSEGLRDVFDVKYIRKSDSKVFKLEFHEDKSEEYDGVNRLFLHHAIISYNTFYNNLLTIKYSENDQFKTELPDIDSPNFSRHAIIDDYNFDGYDDISFSIPDAGMGVYRTFTVFIFDPATKKFKKLKEPDFSKAKCSCFCDLKLDKVKKEVSSACRGGARWWKDVYQYKNGNLVWLRSGEAE
ncbi:hypothetical protein BA768_18130 [Chryseobacterium sp. CBo1]|uniref:XAC2610-related protein n=1 Tax=Chryseobacterium sp. CBo1 TaxID=1869230 RepID=UPI000810D423|nr:hypothetical protein [Chryseobacterium sp. CBo1]OCK51086.1 hypothetical protein BA768_18130 [Chryseobacterium sp. CBo1]